MSGSLQTKTSMSGSLQTKTSMSGSLQTKTSMSGSLQTALYCTLLYIGTVCYKGILNNFLSLVYGILICWHYGNQSGWPIYIKNINMIETCPRIITSTFAEEMFLRFCFLFQTVTGCHLTTSLLWVNSMAFSVCQGNHSNSSSNQVQGPLWSIIALYENGMSWWGMVCTVCTG